MEEMWLKFEQKLLKIYEQKKIRTVIFYFKFSLFKKKKKYFFNIKWGKIIFFLVIRYINVIRGVEKRERDTHKHNFFFCD
jgi:hypothetical protein